MKFTGKAGASSGEGKTPTQDVSELNLRVLVAGSGYANERHQLGHIVEHGQQQRFQPARLGSSVSGWVFGDQFVDVKDTENWAQIDGEWSIASGMFTTLDFGARAMTHERTSGGVVIGQAPEGCGGSPLTWSGLGTYNSRRQLSFVLQCCGNRCSRRQLSIRLRQRPRRQLPNQYLLLHAGAIGGIRRQLE